jgi:hypothetical protein
VSARVDHLVIAARSLDEGEAWCEATFGVTPGCGGRHRLMGTHNRLFAIGSPAYPGAYLEIIAIDPDAAAPGRPRWFDLDEQRLQGILARGPRLVHFVARCAGLDTAAAALRAGGHDPGELVRAERDSPQGTLRWRLTIRADGGRLCHGALPALIEWDSAHPADDMPPCGVMLTSLAVAGADAACLQAAYDAIRLDGVSASQGPPDLVATFHSPRGTVTLHSDGA